MFIIYYNVILYCIILLTLNYDCMYCQYYFIILSFYILLCLTNFIRISTRPSIFKILFFGCSLQLMTNWCIVILYLLFYCYRICSILYLHSTIASKHFISFIDFFITLYFKCIWYHPNYILLYPFHFTGYRLLDEFAQETFEQKFFCWKIDGGKHYKNLLVSSFILISFPLFKCMFGDIVTIF